MCLGLPPRDALTHGPRVPVRTECWLPSCAGRGVRLVHGHDRPQAGRSRAGALVLMLVLAVACSATGTAGPPSSASGASTATPDAGAGSSASSPTSGPPGTRPSTRPSTPVTNPVGGSGVPVTSPATTPADVTAITISVDAPGVGALTFDALAAGDPAVATQGRLVLLLHGFPETDESYRDLLPAVARAGYYAVAFNQRGYSPRARPPAVEDYVLSALVSDVMLVAQHFGAPTFHVVGHDWGGAVAWVTAAAHPDAVRTLTALSTPHPDALSEAMAHPDDPQSKASGYMQTFRAPGSEDRLLADGRRSFLGIFGPGAGLPPDKAEAYADVLATPPALGAALNWYRATPLPSPMRVGPVSAPTLYVFGAADGAFAVSTAQATAAHVTGPYRYVELAGLGHWLPETAAPAILQALLPHLAGTDPAR